MKLKKLFKDLDVEFKGSKELEITGISSNSKRLVPGHLFLARKGEKFDASHYIEEALHNGALAILCDRYNPFIKTTQILHPKPQELEALLAARFYEEPSHQLRILAVTGTNGKTTVSSIIQQLLQLLHPHLQPICGLIGTIGYDTGRKRYEADHTTPDSVTMQRLLREMVSSGCKFCSMEASSHALVQGRLKEVECHTGIFTNLSHEHLDYHETIEAYAEAKSELFNSATYAKKMTHAIVNSDDTSSPLMVRYFTGTILRYGRGPEADLQLIESLLERDGTRITLRYKEKNYKAHCKLVGHYNVMNILAAVGALLAEGFDLERLLTQVSKVKQVRGRLERITTPKGLVYVDYAHKPDALEQNLLTLRSIYPSSQITCVFGCGGDRDVAKRPLMGAIAEKNSDRVIVTSDNPRSEPPLAIIDEILKGVQLSEKIVVEADRAKAIALALSHIKATDVILIAGKGHETYQIIGSRILPFDDAQVVREYFADASHSNP